MSPTVLVAARLEATAASGPPTSGRHKRAGLWRDARLALGIALGCWLMVFVGGVAAGGEIPSAQMLAFSLSVFVQWFFAAGTQIAILRLSGRMSLAPALLRAVRFVLMWSGGTLLQVVVNTGLLDLATPPGLTASRQSLFMFIAWTSGIVTVFILFRHEAEARGAVAAARLRALQAAQGMARRRVVEAQLQAIQARVEPRMFFAVLDTVQNHYDSDADRAEALLDELIAFLRAALPRLSAISSLDQELDLLASYARLQTLAGLACIELDMEAASAAAPIAFPAGVLLPVLAGLVAASRGGARRIGLQIDDEGAAGTLALVFSSADPLPARSRSQVESTLTALYGEAAQIHGATAPDGACLTRITIAHDRL